MTRLLRFFFPVRRLVDLPLSERLTALTFRPAGR
jgi:hypothetical protein